MSIPDDIREVFFETMSGDKSLPEFEAWVYGNKELENLLSPELYLDLISCGYHHKESRYELTEILEKIIDPASYEKWRLERLLDQALDKTDRLPEILIQFYELYCQGYGFLDNLGLGYGLPIAVLDDPIPGNNGEQAVSPKLLAVSFFPGLETEIEKVKNWLHSGTIMLSGARDQQNRFLFTDHRTETEKKPTAYTVSDRVQPLNAAPKKPWWKIW